MAGTVGIGIQDFGKIIENKCFYVDKTAFIKEWWENRDDVTMIIRPRRFGKTLAMSMLEHFFSVEYAGLKHMGGKIARCRLQIPQPPGQLPGDLHKLCRCEGDYLPECKG